MLLFCMQQPIRSFLKVLFVRMITSFFVMFGIFCDVILFKNGKYNITLGIGIWLILYSIQSINLISKNDILEDASFLSVIKFFISRYIKVEHSVKNMILALVCTFLLFLLCHDDLNPEMIVVGIYICISAFYLEMIFDETLKNK